MSQPITTLTDLILQEERKNPAATGSLTLLLTHIEQAVKIIASHARRTGLVDILGKTGGKNAYNQEVEKLDEYSNNLLVETLLGSGQVHAVLSEELPQALYAPKEHAGNYIVCFDPIDGSSNIDTNGPLGTIFSIYHKDGGLLQKGEKQIAAGYVLYGPSTILVYASQYSINGFTYDPSIGSFLLSYPNLTMPKKGTIYSINEGNTLLFDPTIIKYLEHIKQTQKYKTRYMAAMIADIHRILLQGGIFLYPSDKKHPNGKLRLLYEVNPMSFIVEKAGGKAVSPIENPLSIQPTTIDQQVPAIIGSKENIEEYLTIASSN